MKVWVDCPVPGEGVHRIPFNDLTDHEDGYACWCEPRFYKHPRGLGIRHNAADGREWLEEEIRGH
jgi:hypothetical protein